MHRASTSTSRTSNVSSASCPELVRILLRVDFVEEIDGANVQLEARVRTLDEQVLEMNQVRQDVAKRLDDLVTQIDDLDAQLAGSGD